MDSRKDGGLARWRATTETGGSNEQNDLWIVATAHASQAVLVSIDKDFSHLDGVWFEFIFVSQASVV
ncbi:MAG: hypothetical protein OXC11_09455 [Rhodospirillales bacterium]|nr:hypothetical protein [Rhodospirillales bacterium]